MARAADDWLAAVQAQMLRGDLASAQATLTQALAEHPASIELRRARAGILRQLGHDADAEAVLRELLRETPADVASAFALARLLETHGRTSALAVVLRACFADKRNCRDAGLAINAIELLDACDRKADAAAIAGGAIGECPTDARLHAYAGMLEIQLGHFDQARRHYLYALDHDERAWEWHVPLGLSATQRYQDETHADFALFRAGLARTGHSDNARAEIHFALGKMHDDVGNHPQAAGHFRTGNATAHQLTSWSRKAWRRVAEARLGVKATRRLPPSEDFTPIFIVGMPRSGTTLLAELLSRHANVCNRGELPWIAKLAGQPDLSGDPSDEGLRRAAAVYAMHARRDDAPDTRWFIDKQPLNFRYVDLILSMFPQARIIHCRRNARDTALSLWMQCFLEDVQGYAYDFDDMAIVMNDCTRLMARWHQHYGESIRTIDYEDLVVEPRAAVARLAQWIGLQEPRADQAPAGETPLVISTASLWQARQPINSRSMERWRNYAPLVPELLRFPD